MGSMMADQVILSPGITPTGLGLGIVHDNVHVLSQCCTSMLEWTDSAVEDQVCCITCKTICSKTVVRYSHTFSISAFAYPREDDYWFDWGEHWFGLKELRFVVEGIE